MIYQRFVTQPLKRSEYRSLLVDVLTQHEFERIDCAIAYVTNSGVDALRDSMTGKAAKRWETLTKRWLVGIDWFRSQPQALDALETFTSSTVRVHDGKTVLQQQRCTPRVPFHPKTFILRSQDALAVVAGSGNLSRNGMMRGHEVGSVTLISKPTKVETAIWNGLADVGAWFDGRWKAADALSAVRTEYLRLYESTAQLRDPVPTDDDAGDTSQIMIGSASLTAAQLKQLRAARHFWIQAGKLTENLGKGRPGNQLMMKRMTRVFFGRPADDVPRNTFVGDVRLRYQGGAASPYPLRFSDNSMDVMSLPAPGPGGPSTYDYETLLFERRTDRSFNLTLLSSAAAKVAKKKSQDVDGYFQMKGGREYGIY